jgi:Rha family phage regulatory protein
VIRAIEKLMKSEAVNHRSIFGKMIREVEVGKGAMRKEPCYTMTRAGFDLLAMGFTGEKALAYKLAYIDRFQFMETQAIQIAMTVAKKTLVEAHAGEVARLNDSHRSELLAVVDTAGEWQHRAHAAEAQSIAYKTAALAASEPVHKYGERNAKGIPKVIPRSRTFAAPSNMEQAANALQDIGECEYFQLLLPLHKKHPDVANAIAFTFKSEA